MEGVSVGQEGEEFPFYIGINLEIKDRYNVYGWNFHLEEENAYNLTRNMCLLNTEHHIAPLCLARW